MPRLSAWLVRAALLHLTAGATLGGVLLLGKAGWWPAVAGPWVDIHREILLVGWLVQLALGVGWWILPPVRSGAIRERPARRAAALLNGGLLLYVAGALAPDAGAAGWIPALGRLLEGLAVVGFAVPLLRRPFR